MFTSVATNLSSALANSFFNGVKNDKELKIFTGILSPLTRIFNLRNQDIIYNEMENIIKETSNEILTKEEQLKAFHSFKRLYDIGFKTKQGDLRELKRLRTTIENMSRTSHFKKEKIEGLIDINFDEILDTRESYDIPEANFGSLSHIFVNNIQRIFACLFLFESCSMNLFDLFLTFKNKDDQFFAFQLMIVNFVVWGSYHPTKKLVNHDLEIKNPCFNLTLSLVITAFVNFF